MAEKNGEGEEQFFTSVIYKEALREARAKYEDYGSWSGEERAKKVNKLVKELKKASGGSIQAAGVKILDSQMDAEEADQRKRKSQDKTASAEKRRKASSMITPKAGEKSNNHGTGLSSVCKALKFAEETEVAGGAEDGEDEDGEEESSEGEESEDDSGDGEGSDDGEEVAEDAKGKRRKGGKGKKKKRGERKLSEKTMFGEAWDIGDLSFHQKRLTEAQSFEELEKTVDEIMQTTSLDYGFYTKDGQRTPRPDWAKRQIARVLTVETRAQQVYAVAEGATRATNAKVLQKAVMSWSKDIIRTCQAARAYEQVASTDGWATVEELKKKIRGEGFNVDFQKGLAAVRKEVKKEKEAESSSVAKKQNGGGGGLKRKTTRGAGGIAARLGTYPGGFPQPAYAFPQFVAPAYGMPAQYGVPHPAQQQFVGRGRGGLAGGGRGRGR